MNKQEFKDDGIASFQLSQLNDSQQLTLEQYLKTI